MAIKQELLDIQNKTSSTEDGTTETLFELSYWKFDQEFCRKALARMFIVDELPFIHVEQKVFVTFIKH